MIGAGAIVGLLGSAISNTFGWLNRKEDRKTLAVKLEFEEKLLSHEKEEWKHEAKLLTLQSQARVSETESEAFLITTQGSQTGLIKTIESQDVAVEGSSRWVKNTISLFRPILTTAFVAITVYASVRGLGTAIEAREIGVSVDRDFYELVTSNGALATVYGLTELSVTWWFGDRSIKRVMNAKSDSGTNIRGAEGAF